MKQDGDLTTADILTGICRILVVMGTASDCPSSGKTPAARGKYWTPDVSKRARRRNPASKVIRILVTLSSCPPPPQETGTGQGHDRFLITSGASYSDLLPKYTSDALE